MDSISAGSESFALHPKNALPSGYLAMVIICACTTFFIIEIKTSFFHALLFANVSGKCTYSVSQGSSPSIRFPREGPYERRLGYAFIPDFIKRLGASGYVVERQARICPEMAKIYDSGLNMPYQEKQQAGIDVLDRRGKLLLSCRSPSALYPSFDSIPEMVVKALLFMEDRNLLDSSRPFMDPTINWPRFCYAVLQYVESWFGGKGNVPGGSTLATQIEKYRHSPEGRTENLSDKLRQMASATLRAYHYGAGTLPARKAILLDYINTAPLGAAPRFGEIFGLGEGITRWYGAGFDSINAALSGDSASLDERSKAFRMVLGLLLAHRRPGYFLSGDTGALSKETDRYLRLLRQEAIFPDSLLSATLKARLGRGRPQGARVQPRKNLMLKPVSAILDPLMKKLRVGSFYDLVRLDCCVASTLDSDATARVMELFQRLKQEPGTLDSLGLRTNRLLDMGDPAKVIYGLLLFERTGNANVVRIQADSHDAPLDFASGVRMDMGSTAKLRTLITYLEIMEELYYRLSGRNGIVRGIDQPSDSARHDVLTAWAAAFLGRHPDAACDEMLDSSVERSYSASPNESFFTGGGTHRFENFEEGEDGQAFTVREAFARSVNLSFIRLMRDIVNYHIAGNPNAAAVSRDGTGGPWKEYLNSFIQFESGVLLWNFYRQLKKIPAADLADSLACDAGLQPSRLAAIYCAVAPRPSLAGMKDFFERHGPIDTLSELPHRVFTQCQSFSWADRGYVAKIHPLKLWAASRLAENPGLRFGELKAQSLPYLHDMYRWIFSPRRIAFQKSRIKIMLEMEAFNAILHSWRRQGYPFAEMTPSLASAIGASADRPFALAQLAGIIQNDGRQCPEKHIERIHFGAGTPYETVLRIPDSVPCRQVISPEVAGVARSCMFEVTRKGTAVHARTMLDSTMAVGGKTGTGDHRVRYFNRHGRQTGEKVVERTATFVFIIGKRYFGVVTAAVLGEGAKDYGFTSSLPVRIFTLITPKIEPLLLEN